MRELPKGYSDTPVLPDSRWRVHDANRPAPPVVTPPSFSTQERPGNPPSDATRAFRWRRLGRLGRARRRRGGLAAGGRRCRRGGPGRRRHSHPHRVRELSVACGMARSHGNTRRQPRARQQWRVPARPLRSASAGRLRQSHLRRRLDGRHLRPVSAAGERLRGARRLARVRYRVRGTGLRRWGIDVTPPT